VLAFRRGAAIAENRLIWFDRSGKSLGTLGGIADYSNPALSPDGNRLAIGIRDAVTGKRDIWILDLQRDTTSRFTSDASDDFNPAWSPDGARIAFTSDRRGTLDLYVKNASGTGEDELLLSSQLAKNVEDWSQDGRWILFNESGEGNRARLAVLSVEDRKTQDFGRPPFREQQGRLSPDGKWMAYQSNETGRFEVFIRAFPPAGRKWQISNAGGAEPEWRGDGKELFYTTPQDPARIMAVDVTDAKGAIKAGLPHALFDLRLPGGALRNRFVATPDGKKFLAIAPPEQKAANSFTVIVNWPSLTKKK
jgi:Tol biopolymer transport system component